MLYFAIKDSPKRIHKRLSEMKSTAHMSKISLVFDAPPNPMELAEQINQDLLDCPDEVALIIIDTFRMASGSRGDTKLNAYEADMER